MKQKDIGAQARENFSRKKVLQVLIKMDLSESPDRTYKKQHITLSIQKITQPSYSIR